MNTEKHLLVVDDDQDIRDLLSEFLRKYEFKVSTAQDGVEMFKQLSKHHFDLIVLDIMLPGDDGFTLCRKVRADSDTPIIMLTASGEETDRIVGLEMGADDYVAKPFNPRELLARIKAILRRRVVGVPKKLQLQLSDNAVRFESWTLDIGTRCLLSPDNVEIALSAGEFDLLAALIDNAQSVVSRDDLLEITKNRSAGPFDRSIDVQISRLRHKIEKDPKQPVFIKTVRGGGYIFTPQVERISA